MSCKGLTGLIAGAVFGALIVLVFMIEINYVFPMPEAEPNGFYLLLFLMATCVGWAVAEFRSRECPHCGRPMGRPHFPEGEGPGPILYRCDHCAWYTPYEAAVAHEREADRPA